MHNVIWSNIKSAETGRPRYYIRSVPDNVQYDERVMDVIDDGQGRYWLVQYAAKSDYRGTGPFTTLEEAKDVATMMYITATT